MSHDIEQPCHVVFWVMRRLRPGEPPCGQLAAQPREDLLPAGFGEVVARVGRHVGFTGADEELVALEAGRFGIHRLRRGGELVPGARESGLLGAACDLVGAADRCEQRSVRTGVEKPREKRVVALARLVLWQLRRLELERRDGRAHFFTSWMVISFLFSIMSTTRQSPHICSRFSEPSPANIEWPESLPSMLSTIWRVPKGLPQRTQLNGSASFSTTSCFACGVSNSRGARAIAFSGQGFSHSPHCTQLRSINFTIGRPRPSTRRDSGQAPTQAMHNGQVWRFTSTRP